VLSGGGGEKKFFSDNSTVSAFQRTSKGGRGVLLLK
jgi:hypothetical protein